MCQEARDLGTSPLSCGHRGKEVLWHSRPCVFSSCRCCLTLDVVGKSIILNTRETARVESAVEWVQKRASEAPDGLKPLVGALVNLLANAAVEVTPRDSCALDVADQHEQGLGVDAVADLLGVTREKLEAVEASAKRKMRQHLEYGEPW